MILSQLYYGKQKFLESPEKGPIYKIYMYLKYIYLIFIKYNPWHVYLMYIYETVHWDNEATGLRVKLSIECWP